MGNGYSKRYAAGYNNNAPQQQTAMQYLGERYPFGDEEILRLVRCHSYLRRARQVRRSFLSDWAVFCATLPPDVDVDDVSSVSSSRKSSRNRTKTREEEEAEFRAMAHLRRERAQILSVVEGRILPSGFGRRLERAAFLLRRDVIDYRTSSMTDSPITPMPNRLRNRRGSDYYDDEYDCDCARTACGQGPCFLFCGGDEDERDRNARRKLLSTPIQEQLDEENSSSHHHHPDRAFERLEKFLEGAAECSRRGARASLTVLFKCCSRNSRGGYTSDEYYGSGANISHKNLNALDKKESIKANAAEVLDLGYSLAVASAFLSAVSNPSSHRKGGLRGSRSSRSSVDSNRANMMEGTNGHAGHGGGYENSGVESESSHAKLTTTAAALKEYLPNNELQRDNSALEALATSLFEFGRKHSHQHDSNHFVVPGLPPPFTTNGFPPTSAHSSSSHNKSTRKSSYGCSSLNSSERTCDSSSYHSSYTNNTNDDMNYANHMMVTLDVFLEWAESTAPLLSACLATFMHHILFPDRPYPPSRTPFVFPNLRGEFSTFFNCSSSTYLYSLACMSPSLGGTWHRLYTSDCDGLSFNRLQLSLLGYGGPTLIIIRSTSGGVFGAFTASKWKESKDFYGTRDCFLYQLSPKTGMYRPKGGEQNFMYCNSYARSRGYDGLAHGIGFGGTTEQPRLFIDESFIECIGSPGDTTFEPGTLLPPAPEGGSQKYFDIDALEVWGVGGDDVVSEALSARHKQREITAANIQKARKVDKKQFLDDLNSGIIDSKAFAHKQHVRGRVDCDVNEDDIL